MAEPPNANDLINRVETLDPPAAATDQANEWFDRGAAMPPVLPGNDVAVLIDGESAFRDMARAIGKASAPGDFIYIVNWFCDVDCPLLSEAGSEVTLRRLLEQASAAGVMIRALLWKEPDSSQNFPAVQFFNGSAKGSAKKTARWKARRHGIRPEPGLANGAAIHDDRGDKPLTLAGIHILGSIPRALGAQHQKVLCVFAGGKLVSFCGGMDFKSDRIARSGRSSAPAAAGPQKGIGQPLHDVHCRIEGPAAFELVKLFAEKWNDHPDGKKFNVSKGALIVPPVPDAAGDHVVQVGRTYKAGEYQFAPDGEFTASRMIAHAIRKARRFIYTECQYFTGAPALEEALLDALPVIEHLTILLTHWEISDLPFVNSRRRKFLSALREGSEHGHKVRIFTLQPEGNSKRFQEGLEDHSYVHSKIWIMDDELAIVGSLNSNQRSWMHDSEVAAGIYDSSPGRPSLARSLRVRLWEEHLNMKTPEGAAALADGVAGARYWLEPPAGARVRRYNIDERNDRGENDIGVPRLIPRFIARSDWIWNNIFDPD